ncbi:MAG: response regulator [Pigmentiphaga sp.]|nr:response regulator [Pigmentiphaga sp.]
MIRSSTGASLHVLLVEDSAMLSAMLRDMLDELDHVEVAATAPDEPTALQELEQQPIDLLIVDLELREGSGLGVLRHIREEPNRYGRPVRAVFSNYGHEVLRARCKTLGVQHFFDKSLQLDELLDFVQETAQRHIRPDGHDGRDGGGPANLDGYDGFGGPNSRK